MSAKALGPAKVLTGGGRFDPDARPVYFIASGANNWGHFDSGRCNAVLIALNELESPLAMERAEAFAAAHPEARIMLDSGIFALANGYARAENIPMDVALTLAPEAIPGFDLLYERYCEVVRAWEPWLWGYVELDQGGAENKRRTRERLHAEGFRPMPVYHPLLDGWDYFDELASTHDRMCFGNIVQARRPTRIRFLATCAERMAAYPGLWVHMLGMSPTPWMWTWPVSSCDSSSWLAGVRWVQGTATFGMNKTFDLKDTPWRYAYGSPKGAEDSQDAALALAVAESRFANLAWTAAHNRRIELGENRLP